MGHSGFPEREPVARQLNLGKDGGTPSRSAGSSGRSSEYTSSIPQSLFFDLFREANLAYQAEKYTQARDLFERAASCASPERQGGLLLKVVNCALRETPQQLHRAKAAALKAIQYERQYKHQLARCELLCGKVCLLLKEDDEAASHFHICQALDQDLRGQVAELYASAAQRACEEDELNRCFDFVGLSLHAAPEECLFLKEKLQHLVDAANAKEGQSAEGRRFQHEAFELAPVEALDEYIRSSGLVRVRVAGDGWCLPASVLVCLEYSDEQYAGGVQALINEGCRRLPTWPALENIILEEEDREELEKQLAGYRDPQQKSYLNVGVDYLAVIFAFIVNRRFRIYQRRLRAHHIEYGPDNADVIHLRYDADHYDALVPEELVGTQRSTAGSPNQESETPTAVRPLSVHRVVALRGPHVAEGAGAEQAPPGDEFEGNLYAFRNSKQGQELLHRLRFQKNPGWRAGQDMVCLRAYAESWLLRRAFEAIKLARESVIHLDMLTGEDGLKPQYSERRSVKVGDGQGTSNVDFDYVYFDGNLPLRFRRGTFALHDGGKRVELLQPPSEALDVFLKDNKTLFLKIWTGGGKTYLIIGFAIGVALGSFGLGVKDGKVWCRVSQKAAETNLYKAFFERPELQKVLGMTEEQVAWLRSRVYHKRRKERLHVGTFNKYDIFIVSQQRYNSLTKEGKSLLKSCSTILADEGELGCASGRPKKAETQQNNGDKTEFQGEANKWHQPLTETSALVCLFSSTLRTDNLDSGLLTAEITYGFLLARGLLRQMIVKLLQPEFTGVDTGNRLPAKREQIFKQNVIYDIIKRMVCLFYTFLESDKSNGFPYSKLVFYTGKKMDGCKDPQTYVKDLVERAVLEVASEGTVPRLRVEAGKVVFHKREVHVAIYDTPEERKLDPQLIVNIRKIERCFDDSRIVAVALLSKSEYGPTIQFGGRALRPLNWEDLRIAPVLQEEPEVKVVMEQRRKDNRLETALILDILDFGHKEWYKKMREAEQVSEEHIQEETVNFLVDNVGPELPPESLLASLFAEQPEEPPPSDKVPAKRFSHVKPLLAICGPLSDGRLRVSWPTMSFTDVREPGYLPRLHDGAETVVNLPLSNAKLVNRKYISQGPCFVETRDFKLREDDSLEDYFVEVALFELQGDGKGVRRKARAVSQRVCLADAQQIGLPAVEAAKDPAGTLSAPQEPSESPPPGPGSPPQGPEEAPPRPGDQPLNPDNVSPVPEVAPQEPESPPQTPGTGAPPAGPGNPPPEPGTSPPDPEHPPQASSRAPQVQAGEGPHGDNGCAAVEEDPRPEVRRQANIPAARAESSQQSSGAPLRTLAAAAVQAAVPVSRPMEAGEVSGRSGVDRSARPAEGDSKVRGSKVALPPGDSGSRKRRRPKSSNGKGKKIQPARKRKSKVGRSDPEVQPESEPESSDDTEEYTPSESGASSEAESVESEDTPGSSSSESAEEENEGPGVEKPLGKETLPGKEARGSGRKRQKEERVEYRNRLLPEHELELYIETPEGKRPVLMLNEIKGGSSFAAQQSLPEKPPLPDDLFMQFAERVLKEHGGEMQQERLAAALDKLPEIEGLRQQYHLTRITAIGILFRKIRSHGEEAGEFNSLKWRKKDNKVWFSLKQTA